MLNQYKFRIAKLLSGRKIQPAWFYHVFVAKVGKNRVQLIPRKIAINQCRYSWSSVEGHFATIAVAQDGTIGFVICSNNDQYHKAHGRIKALAKLNAAAKLGTPVFGPDNFHEHSPHKLKTDNLRKFMAEELTIFLENGNKRRSAKSGSE